MVRVFGHLLKDVVDLDYCIGCATCIATCPIQCLERINERPVLKGGCINCGICYEMCPKVIDPKTLQGHVFGGAPSDELLGTYAQALSVKADDAAIKAHSQDGGAVTSLLSALLDGGYIDAAVVTGTAEAPWRPVARVATTTEELIECAGTKYSRGPTSLGIREAIRSYYRERVAVVGTPCQMVATRRMQFSTPTNQHFADAIKLRVGLFCEGVFKYEEFFKGVVEKQLRTPLAEVAKFDIRNKRFIIYRGGKPRREFALDAVRSYIDLPCKICSDFTAGLADISVGSAGSPHGRSTVLIRTPTGAEAFDVAKKFRKFSAIDLEKVMPGIEEVRQGAKSKQSMASQQLELLRMQGKILPVWLREQPPEPSKEPIEPVKNTCPI